MIRVCLLFILAAILISIYEGVTKVRVIRPDDTSYVTITEIEVRK